MSEDILYNAKKTDSSLSFNNSIFNESLMAIEDICITINNKALNELGMAMVNRNHNYERNRDYMREKTYNQEDLRIFVTENEQLLNDDQKRVYTTIMNELNQNNGGLYFLDAPGGTGKTFLINVILAKVRLSNKIALAVASSGNKINLNII